MPTLYGNKLVNQNLALFMKLNVLVMLITSKKDRNQDAFTNELHESLLNKDMVSFLEILEI